MSTNVKLIVSRGTQDEWEITDASNVPGFVVSLASSYDREYSRVEFPVVKGEAVIFAGKKTAPEHKNEQGEVQDHGWVVSGCGNAVSRWARDPIFTGMPG